MRYKIIDKQNGSYLDHVFKSKEAIREHLINYHSIDTNKKWLNSMKLEQIMAEFDWEIEEYK